MKLTNTAQRLITSLLAGGLWVCMFIYSPLSFAISLMILLALVLIFEWPRLAYTSWYMWILTPFYPILPWILMIVLASGSPEQRLLLAITYITVFAFDTGAWAIGKLLGAHKLCPRISPGKTWEGFIGGLLSVFIVLTIAQFYWIKPQPLLLSGIFTIIISTLATMGDLFESWLKRRAGIKDSGSLLPGHGGLLDRFDGVLFVIYFSYTFEFWLG